MYTDSEVNLHWIWKETLQKVDSFSKRVAENVDVESAHEFARYLLWSGILKMLERNPQSEPLKVDGAFLRWKANELERACTERWRLKDKDPHLSMLEVQSIHEKLNAIAGFLSKFPNPAPVVQPAPEFKVISGGLDAGPSGVGSEVKSA